MIHTLIVEFEADPRVGMHEPVTIAGVTGKLIGIQAGSAFAEVDAKDERIATLEREVSRLRFEITGRQRCLPIL